MTRGEAGFYFLDLMFTQMFSLSTVSSAFRLHIGHVVGTSSKEQMIRIYTASRVAGVADVHSIGNVRAHKEHVRSPVSGHFFAVV